MTFSRHGTDYVINFTFSSYPSVSPVPSVAPALGTQIPEITTAIAQTSGFSQNLLCCLPATVDSHGAFQNLLAVLLSPLEVILWVI